MTWQTMSDSAYQISQAGCKEAYQGFSRMIAKLIYQLTPGLRKLVALLKVQVTLCMELKLPVRAVQPARQQHQPARPRQVAVPQPQVHQLQRLVPARPRQVLARQQHQPVVQQLVLARQQHQPARPRQVLVQAVARVLVQQLRVLVLQQPVHLLQLQRLVRQPVVQLRQVLQQLKQSRREGICLTQ
ncbi:MAG: topoisomerase II-associated protein [Podoviridae sp. ctg2L5]|nr:MAG: topoisomerase II-associated protein [Podoviridae sp. ctg2L5]